MGNLLQTGSQIGLRVYFDGNFWRVDCHFVDDLDSKSVTLVTWPVCEQWKEELIRLAITILSCLEPLPSLRSVVVDAHLAVGRALAHFGPDGNSVVMRVHDVQWVQRAIRQQFRQRVGGLDPYNVLEFLKYRLSSVVNGAVFDKMPLLRQVLAFACVTTCVFFVLSGLYLVFFLFFVLHVIVFLSRAVMFSLPFGLCLTE